VSREKKTYMVVRVLWLRGEDPEEAYDEYCRLILNGEMDAIRGEILSDASHMYIGEANSVEAEAIYQILNLLSHALKKRRAGGGHE